MQRLPLPCDAEPNCEKELRCALESAGWRYTRQRAAVYSYLRSVETHPTADEVFRAVQVRVPNISLATVYKALDALVAANLALKLDGGDGPAHYDGQTRAHYHCRCLTTGQVRDVPTPFDPDLLRKLDPQLIDRLKSEGFHVTDYRLELIGYREPAPS